MASHLELPKPIKTHRTNPGRGETVEEEEPLSPLARVFHTPQVNCFIVFVFGCKTSIDVDVFKRGLEQTLIKHPRFSSKLVFDKGEVAKPMRWVRTVVEIDDHVIVPDLNPSMESPDQFVEDYASNITKTAMDLSKPLWELHILNVQTSEAASVGIFRIHHSLGDGVSIMSLVLACTRKASDANAFPSLPAVNKKKTMNPHTKGHHWFLRFFFTLMLMFKVFWNTLVDVMLFLATTICLKDNKNPLKGGMGIEQTPRRFVHRMLNFNDVKFVKNAIGGVTVNDVALGITQAGLSRYLGQAKGDKKDCECNALEHRRMRATLFVNLRPTAVVQDLANVINTGAKVGADWGNKIGYVLCPLHLKLSDNPLDYIYAAKATIDQKKQSLVAQFTYFITNLFLNTLGLQAAGNIMYKSLSNTTLGFSNVAGPAEEVSFFGHPVVFIAPSLYGFPQALVIHFQSYMDKMAVILSVDEDVIPDPHKLCIEIENSLLLMKNAIMEKNSAKL